MFFTCKRLKKARKSQKKVEKSTAKKEKKIEKPAKAPITKTELRRVLQNLQQQRLKCKQLEKQISKMNKELQLNNANVDNTLNKNFLNIL